MKIDKDIGLGGKKIFHMGMISLFLKNRLIQDCEMKFIGVKTFLTLGGSIYQQNIC